MGRPMFMFVVYTSRVKGKALLAANEPTAESAAEDGANLGGEVAAAAAEAGRGRFMVKPLQPNKRLQLDMCS